MTRPQPRRILAIAATNVLLTLGLLVLLEGGTRLLVDRDAAPLFDDPELYVRNRPYVDPHPTRGFALRPGFRSDTTRINAAGFRGAELPADIERRFVILALGESTTFGWRVGEDETYPHHLQQILDEAGFGDAVYVVNAGTPSYTLLQALLYLRELLPRMEPDLVIAHVVWNDVWFSSIPNWYPELLVHRAPPEWRRVLHRHSALFRLIAYATTAKRSTS